MGKTIIENQNKIVEIENPKIAQILWDFGYGYFAFPGCFDIISKSQLV
jgi:hypothetical protein